MLRGLRELRASVVFFEEKITTETPRSRRTPSRI